MLVARALHLTRSPRRFAVLGSLASFVAFARVCVLLIESLSAVRSERLADAELLRLCALGKAEESVDFRSLCMRKRASHASPLVLKAVLRACGTAFADFAESVSSPTKLVLIILFCLTGTAAPMIKAVSMLCLQQLKKRRTRRVHDSDSDREDGHHEIVVVSDRENRWNVPFRRAARRLRAHPRLSEPVLDTFDDIR